MAGTVEPPAADAQFGGPLVGDCVALTCLGNRPVEPGFERRDQREPRESVAEHPHGFGVRRIMSGRYRGEGLHRGEDRVVDQMHTC